MKKTQFLDLLTTIHSTLVSFFAITMFVGLGVGLYLGIHWVAGAMHEMANSQFDKGNAHHVEIMFPFGLTDENLERIAQLDGVNEVEGSYLSFQECVRKGRKIIVRVGQLPESIDTFVEVEGTLPKNPGEIAIETKFAENYDLAIGDAVSFIADTTDKPKTGNMTYLNRSRFTVTAIVKSPAFLAANSSTYGVSTIGNGSIQALAWIGEQDFDTSAYDDGKPYVLVRTSKLDGLDSFSKDYDEQSDKLADELKGLSDELASARFEPAITVAQAAFDKGQATYDVAAKELEDKRAQLAEAEQEYQEAKEAYDTAQKAVDDARAEYDDLTAKRDAGEMSEAEYNARLDQYGMVATLALAAYDIKMPYTIDHTNMKRFLDDAQSALDKARKRPIEVGGQAVTLDTADEAIADAHKAIDKAQTKLDEAAIKLEEGSEALAVLKSYDGWIVITRENSGAMQAMDGYASITQNLRWSMASLFLIVGLLVCYSAVSRIVHEQITRIGTKKAVGLHDREVNRLFMGYSTLCVALGLILGVVLAVFVVENILISSMGNRFVTSTTAYVNPMDIVLIGALELALILGATWLAVRRVITMQAVELLAGERPPTAKKRFYEDWAIWKRASLLVQTTVNNCINDTRRVVGTLVGVAGCTALIVCAVTLDDNVMRSFKRQYEQINRYDTLISINHNTEASEQGQAVLEGAGMRATPVLYKGISLEQENGNRASATLIVPADDEAFKDFFTIIPATKNSGKIEGAWVSQAYHEHLGAKVGDTLTLVDNIGGRHQVPIAGFFEYHLLQHEIVLSRSLYEDSFGVTLKENRFLVDTAGKGSNAAFDAMRGLNGYLGGRDDYSSSKVGFDEFSSIARIVVIVYLVLAVVMAACVLLNLDFMFVDEKKRELIVLMINGYSLKDAKGYIWHDSVVLTALGIILGLFLGGIVGSFTIRSIEQANSSFLHGVSWLAVAVGSVGSVVLAAAALLIALRRIDKLDLTDINRF